MHVFYQYYLANGATSGTANYSPYITNSNDGLVKNYGTFSKTTTSTSITTDYPSAQAWTPVNGGDKAKLVVVLTSIT